MITGRHHTSLDNSTIERLDIQGVQFHLDAKREDIVKLFEDVTQKMSQEGRNKAQQGLNTNDILTQRLIDNTSTVKSTLKHVLNNGSYKELKNDVEAKGYFQQEKDLVVRLRDILDGEINVIDEQIEDISQQHLVISEEILFQKKILKEERDRLTIFASALKDYIRKQ